MTNDPSHPDQSNDEITESYNSVMPDSLNHASLDLQQLNRSTPPYLSAYGLTEAPFSLQHNDRFLYLSSELNEQFELLKHYTQYGNLLLIVSGEHGIGKSSLKQRFVHSAQEEWKICEIQADTMMDASLLLRQIATGFGITEPPHDPSVLFEVLNSQLEHLHSESYEPILIIDDAHELPQEALKSLLYLAEHRTEQQSALRIILFCEPVIETMLESPAIQPLKDKVTHNIKIPAFDEHQTAEYLKHRLAVAGFDGTSPFTPTLIHKIYTHTSGVPAKINEAAHQNLLDDSEPEIEEALDIESKHSAASTLFSLRNILLAGVASAIILSVLIFQNEINALFEEPDLSAENALTENKTSDVTPIKRPAADVVTENIDAVAPQVANNKTIEFTLNNEQEEKTLQNEQPPVLVKDENEPEVLTKKIVAPKISKKAIELKSVNPSPVPANQQRQIISIVGSGFDKRQKVKLNWTSRGQAKEKILSDNQINVTSESYMNLIINVGTQSGTWNITVIDPVLKTESNSINFNVVGKNIVANKKESEPRKYKITAPKVNGIYGESWLRNQNKTHFTLQLLGTHHEATAKNYLKKFSLTEDAAIFKVNFKGKDWFTLLYGNYSSKSTAQAAAKTLPKGVSKPWVRSFASVVSSLGKQTTLAKPSTATSLASATSTIPKNTGSWLWSQDPRHYTLQLLASGSKQAIESYILRHKLKGKAARFHRLRDGKDWYILLFGSYDGYSNAKQAISQLPLAIQKSKPWPRRFSAIHAELN